MKCLPFLKFSGTLCCLDVKKWKHLLIAVTFKHEEVEMTTQEDMKHVLSYLGYMATDTRTAS